MGNTTVVATGVKQQGDSGTKKLYSLVDLKGGGELVELMKRARWTKNYKDVDEKIQTEVKKFLYNEGRGKKVPLVELILARSKERESSKPRIGKDKQKKEKELAMIDMRFDEGGGNYLHNKPDRKYREVCWDLNERGTVGETILHLCLLNSTAIHADLAKRLLQAFPKLIVDIYHGDEYYGENCIHMAITNEDPSMVKFLLDVGADYNDRCCGNFFCPDDQKDSRADSLDHEYVDVCERTNYEGHVYLGEYPLSFAACLGQEECVRLLIAKGANPNVQDTNGNTVMHMLVIHDKKDAPEGQYTSKKDMFDLLHLLGAKLDIKNRQGLTPLTLAAKLARKDMYEHILEKVRQVYWIYGSVTCAGYPLKDIDTISPSGEINKDSVLNLVVYGVRFIAEVFVLIGAIWYMFLAMKEIYHQGFRIFFTTLRGAPAKALFLLSCLFVIMMLPGRALCAYVYEDVVCLFAILLTPIYSLFFCRGFKIVGPFVIMIYKMIKGDLLRFFIIYAIFIVGFSQSFYIAFINSSCDPENNPCVFNSWLESMVGVFSMNVGEFEDIYGTFDSCRYPTVIKWAKIVLVVEQSVTTEERANQRVMYSQPHDGDRALVIRWHQSEKEKEELMKIRIQQREKQKLKTSIERKRNILKKAPTLKMISTAFAQQGQVNI
ncbi:hypothetical protein KUTeg_021931 [Tegillarca granosa]|uniref:Transient receptor potential cation channel subfamily V member 6 n=1 Tax=Tegillarca granosa TaxID=220873 RepID=A0ABQ9E553_TEGGR|nr:hypothetical protein KUTeg_021931 [Tegillarca granosa]